MFHGDWRGCKNNNIYTYIPGPNVNTRAHIRTETNTYNNRRPFDRNNEKLCDQIERIVLAEKESDSEESREYFTPCYCCTNASKNRNVQKGENKNHRLHICIACKLYIKSMHTMRVSLFLSFSSSV